MRILVLGPSFPFPPAWGHATRVYHLARQLARRHEVMLLTYATAADEQHVEQLRGELAVEVVPRTPLSRRVKRSRQLASLGSAVPYDTRATHSAEMQAAINRVCAAWEPDAIQLESTLMWAFDLPPRTRIVLDEHNVDYEILLRMSETERSPVRRWFYRFEERRVRSYEQRAWREAHACVLTSSRDEAVVRAHAPQTATAVVANGVDTDYFRPLRRELERRTLVFNGTLDYRPNVDAAVFLVEEILPRLRRSYPEARAIVVGKGPPDVLARLQSAGAEVTGEVPDIRPFLACAEVVAVPVRAGGGTRFKVVEGLSMARPVVSTSIGCEGIDVRHGEHLLVADGAEAFAAGVTQLFEAPSFAASLGRAGRGLVEREYSWDRGGDALAAVYEQLRGAPDLALAAESA